MSLLQPKIVRELELRKFGIRPCDFGERALDRSKGVTER